MTEGFGPGDPRARARGCTCVRIENPGFGREWNTSGCPRHSGLYGGQLEEPTEIELYDDLKQRVGKAKATRIWSLADTARPNASGWTMASRLAWAEKAIDREDNQT